MSERATLAELQEFANRVREAGGGNPIDALIPAVPEDQSQCLIAKNLNFNCSVNCHGDKWFMAVASEDVAQRISEALDLPLADEGADGTDAEGNDVWLEYAVYLPDHIGRVAADFDEAGTAFARYNYFIRDGWDAKESLAELDAGERVLLREMLPYIEMATEEARSLATIINEDGSIVL